MASEQPHVLPRTVGQGAGDESDRARPWGTAEELRNPNLNGAGGRALGWEGPRGVDRGRRSASVVARLTPFLLEEGRGGAR